MPKFNRKQIDYIKQLILDNWSGKNGQYPVIHCDTDLALTAYKELMSEIPARRSARFYYEE
jgi:hypothetical protein